MSNRATNLNTAVEYTSDFFPDEDENYDKYEKESSAEFEEDYSLESVSYEQLPNNYSIDNEEKLILANQYLKQLGLHPCAYEWSSLSLKTRFKYYRDLVRIRDEHPELRDMTMNAAFFLNTNALYLMSIKTCKLSQGGLSSENIESAFNDLWIQCNRIWDKYDPNYNGGCILLSYLGYCRQKAKPFRSHSNVTISDTVRDRFQKIRNLEYEYLENTGAEYMDDMELALIAGVSTSIIASYRQFMQLEYASSLDEKIATQTISPFLGPAQTAEINDLTNYVISVANKFAKNDAEKKAAAFLLDFSHSHKIDIDEVAQLSGLSRKEVKRFKNSLYRYLAKSPELSKYLNRGGSSEHESLKSIESKKVSSIGDFLSEDEKECNIAEVTLTMADKSTGDNNMENLIEQSNTNNSVGKENFFGSESADNNIIREDEKSAADTESPTNESTQTSNKEKMVSRKSTVSRSSLQKSDSEKKSATEKKRSASKKKEKTGSAKNPTGSTKKIRSVVNANNKKEEAETLIPSKIKKDTTGATSKQNLTGKKTTEKSANTLKSKSSVRNVITEQQDHENSLNDLQKKPVNVVPALNVRDYDSSGIEQSGASVPTVMNMLNQELDLCKQHLDEVEPHYQELDNQICMIINFFEFSKKLGIPVYEDQQIALKTKLASTYDAIKSIENDKKIYSDQYEALQRTVASFRQYSELCDKLNSQIPSGDI